MEYRGAGAPTRVPHTFSTLEKEAEVSHGSGCLRWAKRAPRKRWVESKDLSPAFLAATKTPLDLLGLSCQICAVGRPAREALGTAQSIVKDSKSS